MSVQLHRNLLRREIDEPLHSVRLKTLYSDLGWVRDLDIVDELDGHKGCVNALTWSQSGQLLASGSDDENINIFSYQPSDSDQLFSLSTTIATGHQRNIFGVKFMPHSNDNILVSCAGDDVRVYDIEYTSSRENNTESGHKRRKAYHGSQKRDLSLEDVNGKAFKPHDGSVKRIVTEASPFLFLTCSEDGEVRQFDLRLPSSSYPRAPWTIWFMDSRNTDNRPLPLISYARWSIGINSISCSPKQPHNIVLAGQHPHCFLHDRRMTGSEHHLPLSSRPTTWADAKMIDTATRCVQRFTPAQFSDPVASAHMYVTACKISDVRPNEMIASWGLDHIYAFDLTKGIGTPISSANPCPPTEKGPLFNRFLQSYSLVGDNLDYEQETPQSHQLLSQIAEIKRNLQLCHSVETEAVRGVTPSLATIIAKLTPYLRAILSLSTKTRSLIDEIVATRPLPEACSKFLRGSQIPVAILRDQCRRFVNNTRLWAETLLSLRKPTAITIFHDSSTDENFHLSGLEHDFAPESTLVGCIVEKLSKWLTGRDTHCFDTADPEPQDKGQNDFEDSHSAWLRRPKTGKQYLSSIVGGDKVYDFDVPCCDKVEEKFIFNSESDLVAELYNLMESSNWKEAADTRSPAIANSFVRRWLLKVARNLLLRFFDEVSLTLLKIAFGGNPTVEEYKNELSLHANSEFAYLADEFLPDEEPDDQWASEDDEDMETEDDEGSEDDDDDEVENDEDTDAIREADDEGRDQDNGESRINFDLLSRNDNSLYDSDNSSRAWSDAAMFNPTDFRTVRKLKKAIRSLSKDDLLLDLDKHRSDAPLQTLYQAKFFGASNCETIKDCAYYGLHDEFIVAGSDTGHVFIWDRFTGKLVNVLGGDADTVNVVEAHPHEPLLAVSGIDDTIKIFSPDHREQALSRAEKTNSRLKLAIGRKRDLQHAPWPTETEVLSRTFGDESHIPRLPPTSAEGNRAHGQKSRQELDNTYSIIARNENVRLNSLHDAVLTFREERRHARNPDTGEPITLAEATAWLERLDEKILVM